MQWPVIIMKYSPKEDGREGEAILLGLGEPSLFTYPKGDLAKWSF